MNSGMPAFKGINTESDPASTSAMCVCPAEKTLTASHLVDDDKHFHNGRSQEFKLLLD